MKDLREIRYKFDITVDRQQLSPLTVKKYRRWIREYLKYCGGRVDRNLVAPFIQNINGSQSNQRQAYFAIRFLLVEVLGEEAPKKSQPHLRFVLRSLIKRIFN